MSEVHIVSDNAQLSKKNLADFSTRQSPPGPPKDCRWDSSPSKSMRKQLNDQNPKPAKDSSNSNTSRKLLKSDKWGTSTRKTTSQSRTDSSHIRPTPSYLPRSFSSHEPATASPQSSMRRSTSLEDAPLVPIRRMSSFSSRSKSFSSLDQVSIASASLVNDRFG